MSTSIWGKSLINIPLFGLREIECHRLKSGKNPDSAIIKTLDRGRKFKQDRYISADSVFSKEEGKQIKFKAVCKTSMKKDKRNVYVEIDKTSGEVHVGSCNCPAGKSGYCNHVMALLFEIADYSFHGLKHAPEEIACTSRLKQCGVPGEASHKKPVALTTVQKSVDKRGISSTLYDPRKKKSADKYGERKLQAETISINKNIGFACCVPPRDKWNIITNTPHGQFVNGSPLSFHLNPIVFDRDVHTNICKAHSTPASCFYDKQSILLPKDFFKDDSILLPKWQLNEKEKMYLDSLQLTVKSSQET